jgi:hypothetical protein
VQLYQWRGQVRNFGDELNSLLWPALLPDFFDHDPAEIFLGIGSVLDSRHPPGAVKIVAGAGYGGYELPPVINGNWMIHWVRGPITACRIGLPPAYGLGDPASLIDADFAATIATPDNAADRGVGRPAPYRRAHRRARCWAKWPDAVSSSARRCTASSSPTRCGFRGSP